MWGGRRAAGIRRTICMLFLGLQSREATWTGLLGADARPFSEFVNCLCPGYFGYTSWTHHADRRQQPCVGLLTATRSCGVLLLKGAVDELETQQYAGFTRCPFSARHNMSDLALVRSFRRIGHFLTAGTDGSLIVPTCQPRRSIFLILSKTSYQHAQLGRLGCLIRLISTMYIY